MYLLFIKSLEQTTYDNFPIRGPKRALRLLAFIIQLIQRVTTNQ